MIIIIRASIIKNIFTNDFIKKNDQLFSFKIRKTESKQNQEFIRKNKKNK